MQMKKNKDRNSWDTDRDRKRDGSYNLPFLLYCYKRYLKQCIKGLYHCTEMSLKFHGTSHKIF